MLVAAAAAHTAWVLGPWGRGELGGPWALAATLGAASLVGVALARRAVWPLLALTGLWAAVGPVLSGAPAWIALATLTCHLTVALVWHGARAPGAPDPVVWTERAPMGAARQPAPVGPGPWAAAPLAAVAGVLVSPQALGAARIAWAADPGRALAGLGAVGVAGGLLFAAAAGRPRLALRGSVGRAGWLAVHAALMLGLWGWLR